MVSVPKEFFFEGMPLPVSVYLRMKKDNYILIGKKGEKVNFTKLHSYQAKDSHAFVRREDQGTLIQFATNLTQKMMVQPNIPKPLKGKFLNGLCDNAMASIADKGFANVAQLNKVSGFLMELSETVSTFDEIMALLSDIPNEESKHAMSTCMIALLIAEEMELTHKVTMEKLAMGSLLHDIGMKTVPQEILSKARHLWTPEEQSTYEQHTIRGVEMLRDLKDVSNDVLLIVAEHHENAHGTGFPKRIRDVKISPLGRIVILANYFTELLYSRHGEGKDYTSDGAVAYIEEILGQPFNKQVFSALKNIINKINLSKKQST